MRMFHVNLRNTISIYPEAKWWTYSPDNPIGSALQAGYVQLYCLRFYLYNSNLAMALCRPAVDWLRLAEALRLGVYE